MNAPSGAKTGVGCMHPKWHEASYSAVIPGWQRFKAAEDWLVQHNVMTSSQLSEKAEFDRFMVEKQGKQQNDPGKRNELFREFLDWRKGKGATGTVGPR